MICLAFVPVDDVIFVFEALRGITESIGYFEDTYIGACRGNRRVKQNLAIPIGTFLIGCSAENLVRTMH